MSVVANRYAEAFFSLSVSKKSVNEYKKDLLLVNDVFNNTDKIKDFFESELISKKEKKEIIQKLFADTINVDSLNLLKLLIDKGRIRYYSDIISSFIHLANDELNIKEGIIEVARPLNKEKIKELEKALSKDNEKVELKQRINESLISGFKIKFADEVIDASMKEKINRLRNMLNKKGDVSWN